MLRSGAVCVSNVNTLRSSADDISTISNVSITGRNVYEDFINDDSIVSSNSSEDYVNDFDDNPNNTTTGRNVSLFEDCVIDDNISNNVNTLCSSADDISTISNVSITGRNVYEDFINDDSIVSTNSSEDYVNDFDDNSNNTTTGRNVSLFEDCVIEDNFVPSSDSSIYEGCVNTLRSCADDISTISNITITGRNVSEDFINDDSIVSSNSSEDYLNMLRCSADDIPNKSTTGRNVSYFEEGVIDDSFVSSSNSSISSEDSNDNSVSLDLLLDRTLADSITETSSESDDSESLSESISNYENNNNHSNLSIYYTNADSLLNKRNELELEIYIKNPDFSIITELFPKCVASTDIGESELKLKGYELIKGNIVARSRGVCIYYRDGLHIREIKILNDFKFEESCWCSINLENNKLLLIGAIYRSPS